MAPTRNWTHYPVRTLIAMVAMVASGGWAADKSGLDDLPLASRISSLKPWPATGVQLSRDGRFLLLKYYDDRFAVWDLQKGDRVWETEEDMGAAILAADSHSVFTVGDQIRQWDLPSGKLLRPIGPEELGCSAPNACLAATPDGKKLISFCADGEERFMAMEWSLDPAQSPLTFSGPNRWIQQAAVSPDGRTLALACPADDSVQLCDLSSGKYLGSLSNGPHEQTFSLCFSPDGKTLVAGCYDDRNEDTEQGPEFDSRIFFWDWKAGKPERSWKGPAYTEVMALAPSPDGRWLGAGYGNDLAEVWDLSTGKVRWTFHCRVDPRLTLCVDGLAVSPDGRYWVTGSTDGTTRFWDDRSGKELGRLVSFKDGWVVMTPGGDFDGSPAGIRALALPKGGENPHRSPGLLAKILSGAKN